MAAEAGAARRKQCRRIRCLDRTICLFSLDHFRQPVESAARRAEKALLGWDNELDAMREALRKLHAAELAALTTRQKEATSAFEKEAGANLQDLTAAVSSEQRG